LPDPHLDAVSLALADFAHPVASFRKSERSPADGRRL